MLLIVVTSAIINRNILTRYYKYAIIYIHAIIMIKIVQIKLPRKYSVHDFLINTEI